MNRVNELLMRALLNALAFLDLSGDDEVDPDSALKVLEYAGYLLNQLDQADKQALLAFVGREAATERPGPHRDFLLAFPDAFGLNQ
jgi:hypothetical protein